MLFPNPFAHARPEPPPVVIPAVAQVEGHRSRPLFKAPPLLVNPPLVANVASIMAELNKAKARQALWR